MKKSIKKLLKPFCVIFAIVSTLSLTGCTTFGVPNDTWNQLSPAQKQIAMQNYNEQQRERAAQQAKVNEINAENAPLNNAISGLMAAIPEKTHTSGNSVSTTNTQCSGNSCESTTNSHGSSTSFSSPF